MYLTEMIKKMRYNAEEWGKTKQMILLEAPTGCGKTVFAQHFLTEICLKSGNHLALIVNRRVLKEQVEKKNKEFMLKKHLDVSPLSVYTYQELEQDGSNTKKKLEYLKTCEFVVCDEAAYWVFDSAFNPAAEKSFLRLMRLIDNTSLILMTATPKNLKTLLDEYLNSVNKQRQKEWEKHRDEMECQKNTYLHDKADGTFTKFAKLLAAYPESEEYKDGEYNPGLQPEPYSYESTSQPVQDYAYVGLNCYDSRKKLLEMIVESPKREKWLIFVHSRKEGKKLKSEIATEFHKNESDNRSVSFLSSDYKKNRKMRKIVHTIVEEERYKESVLISTSVLDTGITISDSKVRNIVINTSSESEFKQMLGRRRVKEGETINLFICGYFSYFKKCRKNVYSSFCKALPIIGKKPDEIKSAILQREIAWETIDEYTFPEGYNHKFSKLSYWIHSQEYINLCNIIQEMETDSEAYIKLICNWLGKNPDSDVRYCRETISDASYEKIAEKICSLPSVISREQFKGFVGSLNEIVEKHVSSRVNAINEFLAQNKATDKYCFISEEVNKDTYYFIEINRKFPFQLNQDITDIGTLENIIKENECLATSEIFKKLFNTDMPGIIEQGKQSKQSKFVSTCVRRKEGFENVSFRRSGEKFGFYKKE